MTPNVDYPRDALAGVPRRIVARARALRALPTAAATRVMASLPMIFFPPARTILEVSGAGHADQAPGVASHRPGEVVRIRKGASPAPI